MSTPKWNNKKKQNKNNNNYTQFSVLIGNYPQTISPDAIIQAILMHAFSIYKIKIDVTKGTLFNNFEFSIFLPNKEQMDALINLNGSYIYNNPIWIIKYPFQYQNFKSAFIGIISSSITEGQADFTNFAVRSAIFGKSSKTMNFNNRDFTEFFFYLLGSESRDKRMYIETLVLTNNSIDDINKMSSFFFFLPTLRKIIASQNPLKQEPSLTQWPRILIVYDPVKNKKGNQDLWAQNKNEDQSQNPWNQNQNQNNKSSKKNQNNNNNKNQDPWTQIPGTSNINQLFWFNNQNQNGWNLNQSFWGQNQYQNQNTWNQNQNNLWGENQNQNNPWAGNQNQNNPWAESQDQNNPWSGNQNQNNPWAENQNYDNYNQNNPWSGNQNQNSPWAESQNYGNNNQNAWSQNQNQNQNIWDQTQYQDQDQNNTAWGAQGGGGGGLDSEEPPDVSGRIQMTDSGMTPEMFRMLCSQNVIHD